MAYTTPRAALEVDLQAYSPISSYSLVSTDAPAVVYTDNGAGVPPVVAVRPFTGRTTASDGVVNFSIGGNVQPFVKRTLHIHGSVGTNQSPVAAADQIFNKVDLISSTIGVSGTFGKLVFAAGVSFKRGTEDDVTLRNLLNGQMVHTSIKVSTTGFIYSLAYVLRAGLRQCQSSRLDAAVSA